MVVPANLSVTSVAVKVIFDAELLYIDTTSPDTKPVDALIVTFSDVFMYLPVSDYTIVVFVLCGMVVNAEPVKPREPVNPPAGP